MKKCSWCGKEFPDEAEACDVDGTPFDASSSASDDSSRPVKEPANLYAVKVLLPFVGGSGETRPYAGTCTLYIDDEHLVLMKEKLVGQGLEASAPWKDVVVLKDLLQQKQQVSLLIGGSEFNIKLKKGDAQQFAGQLLKKAITLEERRRAVAAGLDGLPFITPKKAARIERNFAGWSGLFSLWLFFGFFNIFGNFSGLTDFSKAIDNLKMASSPLFTVKPEYAEMVRRISPHIDALENLQLYYGLVAIAWPFVWFSLFRTERLFFARQKDGPKRLLGALAVIFAVHVIGALLTIPIPMMDVMGFVDIAQIRVFPIVMCLLALTLTPFYGKNATIFYQYTAVDKGCFKKNGVGLELLKKKYEG